MKNIMTEKQSEALTKFGVEHTGKESIKTASDLLRLAIYTAQTRRTDYNGYIISNVTFDALRKRIVGQELTRDEFALVCLWLLRIDQDLEEARAKYGNKLDEGL